MPEAEQKVREVLAMLRPVFQRDRGDIEFVSFDEGTGQVSVRMTGACHGCGMADFTLKFAVEDTLKERLPSVRSVIAVA